MSIKTDFTTSFSDIKINPKGKYYLTNADLLPAVIEAQEKGMITNKLAKMLMLLTERYSKKSNFVGYSFREDMVSVALVNLCKVALKFDPARSSNPFSFYTTAIHNSFLQYMSDEKKHRNIRDSLLLDAGANPSYSFLNENGYQHDEDQHVMQDLDSFKKEIVETKEKIIQDEQIDIVKEDKNEQILKY